MKAIANQVPTYSGIRKWCLRDWHYGVFSQHIPNVEVVRLKQCHGDGNVEIAALVKELVLRPLLSHSNYFCSLEEVMFSEDRRAEQIVQGMNATEPLTLRVEIVLQTRTIAIQQRKTRKENDKKKNDEKHL